MRSAATGQPVSVCHQWSITGMRTRLIEYYGPERAEMVGEQAELAGVFIFGALMETITTWLEGNLSLTRDELIEHTADLGLLIVEHVYRPTTTGRTPEPATPSTP